MPDDTMHAPDTIEVSVELKKELVAEGAEFFVSVAGESFFTGTSALKKAREIAQLVADLKNCGIEESDIRLESVTAKTSSGLLGRSSSATYRLRINCPRMELAADVLGAITSQKNTELSHIEWRYEGNDPGSRQRWLDEATTRVHEKARRVAANLGTTLAGVYDYQEQWSDEQRYAIGLAGDDLESADYDSGIRRRKMAGEDLGLAISHRKEITLRIEVEYHVSGYKGQ